MWERVGLQLKKYPLYSSKTKILSRRTCSDLTCVELEFFNAPSSSERNRGSAGLERPENFPALLEQARDWIDFPGKFFPRVTWGKKKNHF